MTRRFILTIAGIGLIAVLIRLTIPFNSNQEKFPELLPRQGVVGSVDELNFLTEKYMQLTTDLQLHPEHTGNWLTLAELYMQEARISGEHGHYYPAALEMIKQAGALKQMKVTDRYRAILDKASVLMSLHRFQEALDEGRQAIKLNPYDAAIYGVLVDANVELGHYAEAVTMADKMVSIRPDIRSYSRISYLREIHGDVDGAIEAMKLAVAAGYPGQEQTEWARYQYGSLLQRYGHADEARKAFEESLVMRTNYPFALAALGRLAIDQGDEKTGESKLREAIAIIPEISFYVSLAELYQKQDREAEALALTKTIHEMLKDDERTGHMMNLEKAYILETLDHNQKEAWQVLQEEYLRRPDNIEVNKHLVQLAMSMDDVQSGEKYWNGATRTATKDPDLQPVAAWLGEEF